MKLDDGDAEMIGKRPAGPVVERTFEIGVDVIPVGVPDNIEHDGEGPSPESGGILLEPKHPVLVGRKRIGVDPARYVKREVVELPESQLCRKPCLLHRIPD